MCLGEKTGILPGLNFYDEHMSGIWCHSYMAMWLWQLKDHRTPSQLVIIKTVFPRYGNFCVKNKTVARLSFLWHGDPYTGKTTSLCWNSPQLFVGFTKLSSAKWQPFHPSLSQCVSSSPLDKMAAILADKFSNAFSWIKKFEFRLKFHWSLFLRV